MTTDSHHWATVRYARILRHHFREGWHKLAPEARRKWLLTIVLGAAGMFGLVLLLVQIGKRITARDGFAWEPDFLRWIEHNTFSFSSAVWFQTLGTDITLWILIFFTAWQNIRRDRPLTGLSIALAFIVLDLVVRAGWASWDRTRPDIIAQGLARPAFHSFPSGHTAKTLAVYGFLGFLWWRASRSGFERILILALMAAIAIVVPVGRMRMGVHWPSDIMAGWILGLTWLTILIWAIGHEEPLKLPGEKPQPPA
jgi:undecaprenyl-diphosphatase